MKRDGEAGTDDPTKYLSLDNSNRPLWGLAVYPPEFQPERTFLEPVQPVLRINSARCNQLCRC